MGIERHKPKLAINKGANNIRGSIKKVARSAEATDTSTNATSSTPSSTNEDSGSLYTEAQETNTDWKPGEPVSKNAAEAGLQATQKLYESYYGYKKAELDYERGIRKDQMQLQRQMQQDYVDQQQQQMMTAALLSGLTPLFGALGQLSKSGGGSGAASGSSGNNNTAKLTETQKARNNENSFQEEPRKNPQAINTSKNTDGQTEIDGDDDDVIIIPSTTTGKTDDATS